MIKFKTKVSCIYSENKDKYFTEHGSPEVQLYDSKYDENGDLIVFPSGVSNLQDYIDSFYESTEINHLVARYQRGEIPDFNFVQGSYIDATNFPKNYAEMVNMVKSGEENFSKLPTNVKEAFDNDPVKFFMSFGTEDFEKRVKDIVPNYGQHKDKVSEEIKDEQKSDE